MGTTCCGMDRRPAMVITLIEGRDLPGHDDDNESDAFVDLRYFDMGSKRNVAKPQRSQVVKTKQGRCKWNQKFSFPVGGLRSTQSLELACFDRDVMSENDLCGKVIIYYGGHPGNSLNDNQYDDVDHSREGTAKYFLPLEWNIATKYEVELEDKEGGSAGRLVLSIVMDDKQGDIMTEEERERLLDNQ